MTVKRSTRISFLVSIAVLLSGFIASSGGRRAAAQPQPERSEPHCAPVGGMILTNFGAIDQNTTMGVATGDLRGAVSRILLGAPHQGAGNTLVFHVQHHWVTESGDTLSLDPATATTVPLSQTLFAIVTLSHSPDGWHRPVRRSHGRHERHRRGRSEQRDGIPLPRADLLLGAG
jgi:hypothetical protein